jgi:hypothetical protein
MSTTHPLRDVDAAARPAVWSALLFALVDRKMYEALEVEHLVSANFGGVNPEWEQRFRADTAFRNQQLEALGHQARESCASLRRRLFTSLWLTLAVCVLALVFGWHVQAIAPSRPFDTLKTCNFIGGALVAWATLFGLGTSKPIWDGDALPDLVAPRLFRLIFLPGVTLLAFGALL